MHIPPTPSTVVPTHGGDVHPCGNSTAGSTTWTRTETLARAPRPKDPRDRHKRDANVNGVWQLSLSGHVMVYGDAETCSLSLAGAATSIIFVATKVSSRVCHDERRVLPRKKSLSRQNFCHDKHTFVATNT